MFRQTAIASPAAAARRRPATGQRLWQLAPRWLGRAAFHGLLLLVGLVALFPIVWLLTGSLQTIRELYDSVHFLPAAPQWTNYVQAWDKGNLHTYLPNSLLYSTIVVLAIWSPRAWLATHWRAWSFQVATPCSCCSWRF